MIKKNLKKIAAMAMAASIIAGAMCPATAMAADKNAGAYGKLTGTVSGTVKKGTAITSVTKNPDNANLTLNVDFKKSSGGDVVVTKAKSGRGVTSIKLLWENLPSSVACAYSAHGIQGGSKNPAYVLYTYTSLK